MKFRVMTRAGVCIFGILLEVIFGGGESQRWQNGFANEKKKKMEWLLLCVVNGFFNAGVNVAHSCVCFDMRKDWAKKKTGRRMYDGEETL